jgi:hypothetical protein
MEEKSYLHITESGYDPKRGKPIKDPYLGNLPSLGACMPNIRRLVLPGDHIFTMSGKVQGVQQFVVGGFEVAEKISAMSAYKRFPEQRLRMVDGELTGNVIVDSRGRQHPLDHHENFATRIQNYIVGRDAVALKTRREIDRGRSETLYVLQRLLKKKGDSPIEVMGRWCRLDKKQTRELLDWLLEIKSGH